MIIFDLEYIKRYKPTIPIKIPKTKININLFNGIYFNRKLLSVENSNRIAEKMKNSKIMKSTIRSEMIVPKPLSKGTFLYLVSKAAREISPERGMVKFKK